MHPEIVLSLISEYSFPLSHPLQFISSIAHLTPATERGGFPTCLSLPLLYAFSYKLLLHSLLLYYNYGLKRCSEPRAYYSLA